MTVRSRPGRPLPPIERTPSLLDQYRDVVRQRSDAITSGDTEKVAVAERFMALIEGQMKRRTMPTQHDITKSYREGLAAIAAQRSAIATRLADGEISTDQADRQREVLRRQARALDADLLKQRADLYSEEDAEARAKRAAWRANSDPMTRYAADYPRLMASPRDASDIATEALWMVDNGQPERAAFLLQVAQDKGHRPDPLLRARIDDALDATDPARKEARAIEDDLAKSAVEFETTRLSSLAAAGFGVTADGSIGEGRPSEVASASIAAKMSAYAAGQTSFPVGDGSNDTTANEA